MELAEICVQVGFCKSKTEAKKMIKAGAIRVDDVQITDPHAFLVIHEGHYIVFAGAARKRA